MATGRFENKLKTEERLKELIKDKPEYVTGFYYSLSRKEYVTKSNYIYGVCNYLNYLQKNGIDINNPINLNLDNTNRYFDDAMYVVKNGVKQQATVSSMNGKWFCLNSFFKYMVGCGKIEENPMDYIDRVRGKDPVKRVYLDIVDVADIFKKIDEDISTKKVNWIAIRDKAVISVFLQTGVRVTALTEINMEDLTIIKDASDNVTMITINITDKENEHYEGRVVGEAAKNLYNWILKRKELIADSKNTALFVNRYLTRATSNAIEEMVRKYAPEINGKQITCHKLRATYARTLYNATGDIYFVQTQMHHKSPTTTALYVGTNNTDADRATDIINNMYFGGKR